MPKKNKTPGNRPDSDQKINPIDEIILDTVREIMHKRGWSWAELARRMNTRPQHLYAIREGKRGIGQLTRRRFADALGLKNVSELLGPHWESPQDLSDFILIPKYPTRLSAGPGAEPSSPEAECDMAFRADWLGTRGSPGQFALFTVAGDSLYPTICDGDVVMVDQSENDPQDIVSGKIYAIVEGNYTKVKILRWQGPELWIHSSRESGEQPYKISNTEHFHIIGRVVWVGHEVK